MARVCWFVVVLLLVATALHTAAQQTSSRAYSPRELEKLTRRANEGNIKSQIKLGVSYQYGMGVEPDTEKAEMWLRKAAGFGNPAAQVQLGLLYLQPQFQATHPGEARLWFLRAASTGFPPAEYNLGLMYQSGFGTPVNQAEAERWIRKAADHGLGIAKTLLAMLLLRSDSGESHKAGFKLLEKAAKSGNPEAQNGLGICYEIGKGTAPNLAKAMEWYRRAAESGNADAMQNLGYIFYFGAGIRRNVAEAARWYRSACDAGNAGACGVVAYLYARGEINPQDLVLAYAFAIVGKHEVLLEPLAARLTAEDRKRAHIAAERWRQEHPLQMLSQYSWWVPVGE